MGAVQPEAGQLQGLRVEIPQTYWSCVSVVNVFHSEDFFLYVLVIIVCHLLLVHLQEEPGSFFINLLSGSGRQQPNSSLSFSPPDRTAPVLSASLPNRMDGLRLGPPPRCQQDVLRLVCATYTQLPAWTLTAAQVTLPGMSEL